MSSYTMSIVSFKIQNFLFLDNYLKNYKNDKMASSVCAYDFAVKKKYTGPQDDLSPEMPQRALLNLHATEINANIF